MSGERALGCRRRWVYASSKLENNYFGFGTDNDTEFESGYPIIKHRTFADIAPATHPPKGADMPIPCAKDPGRPAGADGWIAAGPRRDHVLHRQLSVGMPRS